jgi:hypothetical protein
LVLSTELLYCGEASLTRNIGCANIQIITRKEV